MEIRIERERLMSPRATKAKVRPAKDAREPRKIIPKFAEPKGKTAMGAAMADKYPWTANAIAEELGMPVPSFRAWKMKIEKENKISKPAINSFFCIPDPELGNRLLYSDAYVAKLKELRGTVKARKPTEISPSAMQHAKLKVLVPVFDENVAKYLLKKFGSERGIQDYLKGHVIEISKGAMSKIEELRKKYEQEMNDLLQNA